MPATPKSAADAAAEAAGKLAGNLLVESICELIDAKIRLTIMPRDPDLQARVEKAKANANEIANTIIARLI